MPSFTGIRLAIDRGGTFTDCLATNLPNHPDIVLKILSEDPDNYADAPIEAIRRVLSISEGRDIPRGEPLSTKNIEYIRMGTTVATNALLQRKGERCALLTTKGFKDLLHIGTQSRPKLFDLAVRKPDVVYEKVVEIEERVTMEDFSESLLSTVEASREKAKTDPDLVCCASGDVVRILERPDLDKVRSQLQSLYNEGYRSIAIAFAHSYAFPDHEKLIAKVATEIGFTFCSLSSEISPVIKLVSRGLSATADAYLTPETARYIEGFRKGFVGALEDSTNMRCEFMMSDGGLAHWKKFSGVKAVLSGPAGGYVGFARTSYTDVDQCPVIGFDMGGTSTDVSRFGGKLEHVFETTTAGVTLQTPQLDINTVAAGGGSILSWRNGMFCVGPESAGAHPGPACYRKGGPLTVTDANLLLGRLLPEYFPAIFGPNEDKPLDIEASRFKFEKLSREINAENGQNMTPEEVALGFISVANETMARPVRALTEARGYETSAHRLASFGGAAGQHACDMASVLSIKTVIVHRYSSILSAFGMKLADITHEAQVPCSEIYDPSTLPQVMTRVAALKEKVQHALLEQHVAKSMIQEEVFLNMRFHGTDTKIMVSEPADGDFLKAFRREYKREFTFLPPEDRVVYVDDARVRGSTIPQIEAGYTPFEDLDLLKQGKKQLVSATPTKFSRVYFKGLGWKETPVFHLDDLEPFTRIPGPAVIIDKTQTIVVQPEATATALAMHVVIDVGEQQMKISGIEKERIVDPVTLSVFGHRFMSIAEQMGHTLQKTSVSVAIKERLDFSCAIFGPDGGLCANAPHVPVHLGSMQSSIQYQHKLHSKSLKPGDVLVTNHPTAGGTHLPDLTVISPTFDPTGTQILFYVASRGHHLDIGGLGGNSMPPSATELWEEGAAIKSFKLVSQGVFNESGITQILVDEPAQYPGCVGSRHLQDNLSDLKAQIAANAKGVRLIEALMQQYGAETVTFYMHAIRSNAEGAVREYLKRIAAANNNKPLKSEDFFDDGTRVALEVRINPQDGSAVFDFTGTGPEVNGNANAPPSISLRTLIYSLRCLLASDIPLNQGVLAPITTVLPEGSIINPSPQAAVSTGNGLTSQRLVDVVLKTFGACAGSQGCMGCLGMLGGPLPDGGYAYAYGETICGGNGAGPGWNGSIVPTQVHMTNTRATDIEVLEKRYPMIVREFSIRENSGGKGKYRGGNGAVRRFEAREDLRFSFMSERRVQRPYGMAGGEGGMCGMNLWRKKDLNGNLRLVNLGPRSEFTLRPGEEFIIMTPGGGGWGAEEDAGKDFVDVKSPSKQFYPRAMGTVATRQELQESQ